jgi:hypothetical protein
LLRAVTQTCVNDRCLLSLQCLHFSFDRSFDKEAVDEDLASSSVIVRESIIACNSPLFLDQNDAHDR